MSDKSHVAMEQHQCPICLKIFDTGTILLHKQLKQALNHKELTGHSTCTECQGHMDNGFIGLIGLQREPIRDEAPMTVPRGALAWLKAEAWSQLFNVPVPDKKCCFLPEEVLQSIVNKHTSISQEAEVTENALSNSDKE